MRERKLESLGLSETEETVYQVLLEQRLERPADIAGVAGISLATTNEVLRGLEGKGLATRAPGRRSVYAPTDPDIAVRVLVMRHQDEVERTKAFIDELAAIYRAGSRHSESAELVEVVVGRDAALERSNAMFFGAEREIVGLSGVGVPSEEFIQKKLALLRRGVKVRGINHPSITRSPGYMAFLERIAAAGEQTRLLPEFPTKFFIIDRRIAWVPWDVNEAMRGNDPGALVVHHASLIELLSLLFEAYWARATPLRFGGDADLLEEHADVSAEDRRLLALLASGLVDDAISRQLGVSRRTVESRVSRMKETHGARSRFQLAVLAGERGWLGAPSSNGTPALATAATSVDDPA